MDEKTKATMLKYRKTAREQIQIDMAKGMKAKIKAFADRQGVSMSALILQLIEREMQADGFAAEWERKERIERAEREKAEQAERDAVLAAIRSEMKPPVRK